MDIAPGAAEQIIERLRYGLPPPGFSTALTVGPPQQLERLQRSLHCSACAEGGALLLEASNGAGKSHLLHVVREAALGAGYAVSLVATAQEGVQFHRLDTIFGAVCRRLELDASGRRGISALFQSLTTEGVRDRAWAALASKGRWDYSEYLHSPAMYVALRAWLRGNDPTTRLLAEDWLTNPPAYREQRKHLHEQLIYRWRGRFRDPRPDWKFYAEELLVLHRPGRTQVWDALDDLGRIARLAGRRGLVLLFDELDLAFQQLSRSDQQRQAFRNLFRFFHCRQRLVISYVAVTPDFARRCNEQLRLQGAGAAAAAPSAQLPSRTSAPWGAREEPRRGVGDDGDLVPLAQLPSFEPAPVSRESFLDLAGNIRTLHGLAYGWDAAAALSDGDLNEQAGKLWRAAAPERLRWAIQEVVTTLDARLAAGPGRP